MLARLGWQLFGSAAVKKASCSRIVAPERCKFGLVDVLSWNFSRLSSSRSNRRRSDKPSFRNAVRGRVIPKQRPPPPPVLTVQPFPELAEFPAVPARGNVEEREQLEGFIFTTNDGASNFIDRLRTVNALPELVEASGIASLAEPKTIRVSLRLDIPAELFGEEYREIGQVVGVGEASKVKDARILARTDLGERLVRVLDNPIPYLNDRERRRVGADETNYIPVTLSENLRSQLTKTCRYLNETGIFQISTEGDEFYRDRNEGARWRSDQYQFFSLPASTIRKLPSPEREASKLPIWHLYHRLIQTIEHNNVTILSAATGSGKTTQLPQFILDCHLGIKELTGDENRRPPSVLVTQPRRIAAKTVAERVANEREKFTEGGGRSVGYTVRFDSRPPTSFADGSIVFCTAGILLRRLQREPDLRSVTHLVLDEVHERDVFTDILLLVVKALLKRRPDLRVILMSATMEANKFVDYFSEAGYSVGQVLDIAGTNHPVREHYLEDVISTLKKNGTLVENLCPQTQKYVDTELRGAEEETNSMPGIIIEEPALQEIPLDMAAALVEQIVEQEPKEGAILIFLPGWEEITEMNNLLLARLDASQVEIHLLHSTAPIGSADAAFRLPPAGVRKIILATNIAESSVTIPDVVYVLDSGKQKVMHYDQRLRMNVLEPCWISKANQRQRLGRAGRCQPGKYFAFYTKSRSEVLPEQTLPELLRLGLDEVCLNLKAMGFSKPSAQILATAIDPPERLAVKSAIDRLKGIGAIDSEEYLTPLGRLLANIPIHPAMGKMLITALIFGCLSPVLTAVALMGQRILKPVRLPQEKYDLHAFYSRCAPGIASDHLLIHRVYSAWKGNGYNLGPQLYAYENLFSRPALRRLDEARGQIFRELKNGFGLEGHDADINSNNEDLVRLVLASGFYPDVAIVSKRRNSCRLRSVKNVGIVASSTNHVLGNGAIQATLQGRGQSRDPHRLSQKARDNVPRFLIYEELIDVGQKLMSKTTAVDPLFFILFAAKTQFRQYRLRQTTFPQLLVDGWLSFRCYPGPSTDLNLLDELRLHWNDFVQFVIYKQLRKEQLGEHEAEAVAILKKSVLLFAKESFLYRRMLQDSSVPITKENPANHQGSKEASPATTTATVPPSPLVN